MNWEALGTTLELASLTSVILMLVALPLSYWVAFSQWRWKFLVEAVVALPLVLPPTVLGFYVLVAMGPQSPLGRFYETIVGHGLPFTFGGLVFASVQICWRVSSPAWAVPQLEGAPSKAFMTKVTKCHERIVMARPGEPEEEPAEPLPVKTLERG